jgi:osmotically-inducible protein OsmY
MELAEGTALAEKLDAPIDQAEPTLATQWQNYLSGRAANHPLFRRRQLVVFGGKGYVVLTGKVTSFYEKQVAQEFVRRCEGVRQIDNRIEVAYSSDQP